MRPRVLSFTFIPPDDCLRLPHDFPVVLSIGFWVENKHGGFLCCGQATRVSKYCGENQKPHLKSYAIFRRHCEWIHVMR